MPTAAHLLPRLRHRGPLLRGRRRCAGGVQLPLAIRRACGRVLRLACRRRLQARNLTARSKPHPVALAAYTGFGVGTLLQASHARRPAFSMVEGGMQRSSPMLRKHGIEGTHPSAAAQRFFSGRYFCSCSARNCAFSAAFASRSCECRTHSSHLSAFHQAGQPPANLQIVHTAFLVCSTARGTLRECREQPVLWAVRSTCSRRCSRVAFSAAARSSLAASSRLPASASTCI